MKTGKFSTGATYHQSGTCVGINVLGYVWGYVFALSSQLRWSGHEVLIAIAVRPFVLD